jgi:hypothetical protein
MKLVIMVISDTGKVRGAEFELTPEEESMPIADIVARRYSEDNDKQAIN